MAGNESYTIIVTGAGSGFGALTARTLSLKGHKVYAGLLEHPDGPSPVYRDLVAFANEHKVQVQGLHLDVTNDQSIKDAVDTVVRQGGKIDVVIHNAGTFNVDKMTERNY